MVNCTKSATGIYKAVNTLVHFSRATLEAGQRSRAEALMVTKLLPDALSVHPVCQHMPVSTTMPAEDRLCGEDIDAV